MAAKNLTDDQYFYLTDWYQNKVTNSGYTVDQLLNLNCNQVVAMFGIPDGLHPTTDEVAFAFENGVLNSVEEY